MNVREIVYDLRKNPSSAQ